MSKNIMQMCADEIAGYLKRIAELEKQLAEKEKAHMEAMENALNDFLTLRQELNQAKTDFAIEQLEKVKYNFFDIGNGWWLCFRDGTQYMTHEELEGCVRDVIDQQIKELRG